MNELSDSQAYSIGDVIVTAIAAVKEYQIVFLRTLSLWSIVIVTLSLLEIFLPKDDNVFLEITILVLLLFTYSIFAVTIHRIVLLGDKAVPKYGFIYVSFRALRYGISISLITVAILYASSIPIKFLELVYSSIFGLQNDLDWVYIFIVLPFYYLFARIALVFPAIAIDEKTDYAWSWDITRSNGWRIAFTIGLLPWIFQLALYYFEQLSTNLLYLVATNLLYLGVLFFEVLLLSVTFRYLAIEE